MIRLMYITNVTGLTVKNDTAIYSHVFLIYKEKTNNE